MLYRHDRAIIEKILPKAQRPTPYQKDWEKEDLRLYEAIKKLTKVKNLSISEIGRCVNDHSYIRTSIEKLPKTYGLLSRLGIVR